MGGNTEKKKVTQAAKLNYSFPVNVTPMSKSLTSTVCSPSFSFKHASSMNDADTFYLTLNSCVLL